MLVSEFLVNDIENYHDYQKLLRKRKNKDNNYNCLLSNIALIYYNNPLIFNKFNEEKKQQHQIILIRILLIYISIIMIDDNNILFMMYGLYMKYHYFNKVYVFMVKISWIYQP